MSKVTLNLGWVLVGRWRVNLLSFVLVDGTIRSLGGWYIGRWYRHLRRTVQFTVSFTSGKVGGESAVGFTKALIL